MRLRTLLGLVTSITLFVGVAPLASADPPAHAPAHGYRAKGKGKAHVPVRESAGVEVVFDSERGIHVAVGLPGVFFRDGHYYREHEGRWQVSLSGSGGWSVAASGSIPEVVVTSKKRHPGPANAR
jgi:hypothetical protein